MSDVVATFGGCEEREGCGDECGHVLERAGSRGAEEGFQFRERLFDGIEIGTVGRQEAKVGPDAFDRGADLGLAVYGEIVQDNDVARPERRHQHLLDVGHEGDVIDRAVEDGRRGQPIGPQGGDHRMRLPMATRRVIPEARAAETAPVPPQQVRGDATFIEKHVLPHIAQRQPRAPAPTLSRDVGPSLFVGVDGFF